MAPEPGSCSIRRSSRSRLWARGSTTSQTAAPLTVTTGAASIAAQLRLPAPVISPYVLGGWQIRRSEERGISSDESGPLVGIGVQLNFGLSLFLEGTMEFRDEITGTPDIDTDPIVIKGGILIG